MHCKQCGNKIERESGYCGVCGDKLSNTLSTEVDNLKPEIEKLSIQNNKIIKCGNCNYEGPGEKARSIVAKTMAILCVFFIPLITIIYFFTTHEWKCPKCDSTFVGIKNKKGVFVNHSSGLGKIISFIVLILVGVAILGIISSVILASLNTARTKALNKASTDDSTSQINRTVLLDFKLLKKEFEDSNGSETVTVDSFESTGLSSSLLKEAKLEFDSNTGEPLVSLQFNNLGSELFAKITRENIGRRLAIFVDGEIVSMPVIREEITGGKATISGGFSGPEGLKEARNLVNNLNLNTK